MCHSLILAINWFRETANAFVDQTDVNYRIKVSCCARAPHVLFFNVRDSWASSIQSTVCVRVCVSVSVCVCVFVCARVRHLARKR